MKAGSSFPNVLDRPIPLGVRKMKKIVRKEEFVYKDYGILYIPYEKEEIQLEMGAYDTISGNNIDGFILTRKRMNENG